MEHYNEQLGEVVIRNSDDVWDAMFNYELEEVFGDVLDYFFAEQIQREKEYADPRKDTAYVKPSQKKLMEFHQLCQALDRDQLRSVVNYFLNHFNEKLLILFFEALDVDQQRYFIDLLLSDISEQPESAAAQYRNKYQGKAKVPFGRSNAIDRARQNEFADVVEFLQKFPAEIIKFVGDVSALPDARQIMGGTVLEIFSYLPKKIEEAPKEPEAKAA